MYAPFAAASSSSALRESSRRKLTSVRYWLVSVFREHHHLRTLTPTVLTQEPDTALFLHVGLVNLRGATSVVTSLLESMGAKHNLCNKYYTTSDGVMTSQMRSQLSTHGFHLKPGAAFFHELNQNGTLVYEFPTLHQLWLYCKDFDTHSVIYMQTLGSHKSWSLRRTLTRIVLQAQVLHAGAKECLGLTGRWHCGPNPNFSPCWEHYSGNFWRASCSHINSLPDPTLSTSEFERAMRMGKGHGDTSVCAPDGPLGRYWAEAWVVNGARKIQDKLPLSPIRGTGKANPLAVIVHRLFFRYGLNLVVLFDKVAYLCGVSW